MPINCENITKVDDRFVYSEEVGALGVGAPIDRSRSLGPPQFDTQRTMKIGNVLPRKVVQVSFRFWLWS